MVFYGKGGYDWETIYNMPIWLRKFTFNKIFDHYESENTKQNGNTVQQSINALKSAGFTSDNMKNAKQQNTPTYTTRASKK
jgi:hypothetical protein